MYSLKVNEKSFLANTNWLLVLAILLIQVIGILSLYSATSNISLHLKGVFKSQIVWLAMGWVVFFICSSIHYKWLCRLTHLVYYINVIALIAVLVMGKTANGAQRWIDLVVFRYQPSETMKLAAVLMLAKVFSKYDPDKGLGFRDLAYPLILLLIPVGLTLKQPDLGTSLLLLMIGGTMALAMKVKPYVIITALMIGIVGGPVAWFTGMIKPYQKNRVITFLNPSKDPRGMGYNSIQAKIAVGSGQLLGKGFKKGTQSQFQFLPEKHTDFIFCVLSEEHGFLGGALLLLLFAFVLQTMLNHGMRARDMEGSLICIGVFSILLFHVFINVGMVTGLLPIVGVPLPLMSYGGTINLSIMAALGIASSVYTHKDLF